MLCKSNFNKYHWTILLQYTLCLKKLLILQTRSLKRIISFYLKSIRSSTYTSWCYFVQFNLSCQRFFTAYQKFKVTFKKFVFKVSNLNRFLIEVAYKKLQKKTFQNFTQSQKLIFKSIDCMNFIKKNTFFTYFVLKTFLQKRLYLKKLLKLLYSIKIGSYFVL